MLLSGESLELLSSSSCPSGFVPNLSGKPVRHAIDLSFVPETLLENINVEFSNKYYLPIYNYEKKRISFLTGSGQCKSINPFNNTVISTDSKIHEFNREFLEANPAIQKFYNSVKTYDFREDEGGLDLLKRKYINGLKKIANDFEKDPYQFTFPNWLKFTLSIIIIGGVVYYIPKKKE